MERLETLPDATLTERARNGDRAAISILLNRHRGLVEKLVVQLLNTRDRITIELLRDGFFYHLEENFRFSPGMKAKFSTWLYRTAHNWIIDYLRKLNTLPNLAELSEELARYTEPHFLQGQVEPTISLSNADEYDYSQLLLQISSEAFAKSAFTTQEIAALNIFFSGILDESPKFNKLLSDCYPFFRRAAAKMGVLTLILALKNHGMKGVYAMLSDFCEHPIHFSKPGHTLPGRFGAFAPWNFESLKAFQELTARLAEEEKSRLKSGLLELIRHSCVDIVQRYKQLKIHPKNNYFINRDLQYIFLSTTFCKKEAGFVLKEGYNFISKSCPELVQKPIMNRHFSILFAHSEMPDKLAEYLKAAWDDVLYDLVDLEVMLIYNDTLPKEFPRLVSIGSAKDTFRYLRRARVSFEGVVSNTIFDLSSFNLPVLQKYFLRRTEIQLNYLRLDENCLVAMQEGLLNNYSLLTERGEKNLAQLLISRTMRRLKSQ